MKSQNEKENKSEAQVQSQPGQQVRGAALREKMIESEKEGEKFRAEHQGADQVDHQIKHPSDGSNRTN